MTQIFNDKGDCVPVTVVKVEKCVPIGKRTVEKDGYKAVILAYGERKLKHTNKPLKGFYDKYKADPARILKEFRNHDVDDDATHADDGSAKPKKVMLLWLTLTRMGF